MLNLLTTGRRLSLDGFSLEVIRHEVSICADPEDADLVEPHHYEVIAECTGTNPRYPTKDAYVVKLSKRRSTNPPAVTFESAVPLVVLEAAERYTDIALEETAVEDRVGATLSISFVNEDGGSHYTAHFLLQEPATCH